MLSTNSCLRILVLVTAALALPAEPQNPVAADDLGDATVVLPQRRPVPLTAAASVNGLQMGWVGARIAIHERVASTELLLSLTNPGAMVREAILVIPVPAGVTIKGFGYEVTNDQGNNPTPAGAEKPTAKLMLADDARRTYESIVRRSRDPGLLEFANYTLIRSSVFPVPAGAQLRVKASYEQLLDKDGDRIDYFLPRSETVDPSAAPWTITATIVASKGIQTIYSPSHRLKTTEISEQGTLVEIDPDDRNEAGPFQLSYVPKSDGMGASFISCAEPKVGGGYFLLLSGIPDELEKGKKAETLREVIVVIDRSGSMAGEKMEQAREAAREIVEALRPGEAFNILDYASDVAAFAPAPVIKNDKTIAQARDYLKSMNSGGGTNLSGALEEAMREPATPDMLPLVVFLTDGIPSVGKTGEVEIREAAAKANIAHRRIFGVGVGNDVNAPLLDSIASASRGSSLFVHPQEKVEVKVGQLFKKLAAPILMKPKLEVVDEAGAPAVARVRDLLPGELPDLYAGDQVVVLGQYIGADPIRFRLSGEARGKTRRFDFLFEPNKTQRQESYVARLWAGRKVSTLVDELRQAGAKGGKALPTDPKTKEMVDEILALSTRFGIMSEYTSFFANEPVDLSQKDLLHARLRKILADRAQGERTGSGAVAQAVNINRARQQAQVARGGRFLDGNLKEIRLANIQQRNDKSLFRRGVTWVDSQVFEQASGKSAADPPDRVIDFGTPEYFELARRLADEKRSGVLAVNGQLLLLLDGKRILVKGPA
jgi:Ca-activated chloride channel family protein